MRPRLIFDFEKHTIENTNGKTVGHITGERMEWAAGPGDLRCDIAVVMNSYADMANAIEPVQDNKQAARNIEL